jgi:hypothetical protein
MLATSAHDSSSTLQIRGLYPALIKGFQGRLEEFFPENTDIAAVHTGPTVGRTLEAALKSQKILEKELRYAVYEELKGRGVDFQQKETTGKREYTEAHVRTIFFNFRNSLQEEGVENRKEEKSWPGLMVTASSTPDLTAYRDSMMLFGEVKNNDAYTFDNTSNQCALYLVSLLYFMRVQMLIPVKAVFGFFICGCKCEDSDGNYTVGLVKLSAPKYLGDTFVSHCYSSEHPTDDMKGIHILVNFLQKGKTREPVNVKIPQDRVNVSRTPALCMLPDTLWKDKCLIINGTTSVVFRGIKKEINRLLGEFQEKDPTWTFFMNSINKHIETLPLKFPERQFYLKVRLREASLQPMPVHALRTVLKDLPLRYKELYCRVIPYGTLDMGVFFMADCGSRVNNQFLNKITLKQLCTTFREFREEVLELSTHLSHGDVLPHNIVVTDEDKLMLIDVDEGTLEADAPQRKIDNDNNTKYAYLRYPNFLRSWANVMWYTQIQLLFSFLHFSNDVRDDPTAKEVNEKLKQLQSDSTKVNDYLKMKNGTSPHKFFQEKPENVQCLKNAIATLTTLLSHEIKSAIE